MFKKLFGKGKEVNKDSAIYAPLSGEYVKIEDIPDPVFAQKMMGEGFGINPTNGEVVSPIDGKVDNVFPTKHAIGLKAENGLELLVHIGLDTVQLNGEGFEVLINENDSLQQGQPILKFDKVLLDSKDYDSIIPVIITNSAEFSEIITTTESQIVTNNELLTIINK